MANLTIVVDDEILKQARKRALDRGESVNQFLAGKLAEYALQQNRHRRALQTFVELAQRADGRRGTKRGGRTWTRDGLHER